MKRRSGQARFELRMKRRRRRSVSREGVPPADYGEVSPPFSHQNLPLLVSAVNPREGSFESWSGSSSEGGILETSRNGRCEHGGKEEGSQSTRSSVSSRRGLGRERRRRGDESRSIDRRGGCGTVEEEEDGRKEGSGEGREGRKRGWRRKQSAPKLSLSLSISPLGREKRLGKETRLTS